MQTLLLPGLDGTGRLFGALQEHLPSSLGARVVSYPSQSAQGYEQLLDGIAVPEEPFAIVAESFSGPLGVLLASRHGARVRALVLVATFVRWRPSVLRGALPLLGPMFRFRPPALALRLGLLGVDASQEEVRALQDAIATVDAGVLAFRLGEIARVDVRKQLAETTVPLLYLGGARDRLVGGSAFTEVKRLRPDVEGREVDAPHLVLQRAPRLAAEVISEFIERHR